MMKKNILNFILYAGAVGVLIGICVAIYIFNKPQRDVASEKPAFTLTAGELYRDFSTDEAQANEKYLLGNSGKIIQVSGSVSEIIAQQDTALSIIIKDSLMAMGAILCSVDRTNIAKTSKFKVGDQIALKGECTGYMDLTNEVSLSRCVIVE